MNNTEKNKTIRNRSYIPPNVTPETYGNKKTSSISYNKKKTQINKNCSDTLIGLWDWGLNPHS